MSPIYVIESVQHYSPIWITKGAGMGHYETCAVRGCEGFRSVGGNYCLQHAEPAPVEKEEKVSWVIDDREALNKEIRVELGEPVVVVELDDTQIAHAIDAAEEWVGQFGEDDFPVPHCSREHGARLYAKAMAMLILGRVRRKCGPDTDGEHMVSDARALFGYLHAGPFG